MLFNLQILFDLAPITNVQLILDGIFIGAVISLSAYGLALVWGVMNVKNLAQGDFVILGGYMAFALFNAGVHPVLALPIVMVLMAMFGWMVYILIIRRVIQQDMFTSLLATFGLSLLLQQVLNLIFGPEVQTIDSKMPNYQLFDNAINALCKQFITSHNLKDVRTFFISQFNFPVGVQGRTCIVFNINQELLTLTNLTVDLPR
ncbi:MAG: branched-chain amino acid ABC transporter permease, partial [Alphaproteobacteria bacterium]|nr:branched-chain amino acid ABC transporter permease [Alphaproteobacteria bacterium]